MNVMLIKGRVIQDSVKRFCMFKTVAVSLSVISCSNTALKRSDTNAKRQMIVVMKQLDTCTSRKEILKPDSIQYMNPTHDILPLIDKWRPDIFKQKQYQ